MSKPQWLELHISRTNFHSHKDVQAIKVRLYFVDQEEDRHVKGSVIVHLLPMED